MSDSKDSDNPDWALGFLRSNYDAIAELAFNAQFVIDCEPEEMTALRARVDELLPKLSDLLKTERLSTVSCCLAFVLCHVHDRQRETNEDTELVPQSN